MATLGEILKAKKETMNEESDSKESKMVECPECGCKFDASEEQPEDMGDGSESEQPHGKGPGVAIVLQLAKGKK